jgi:hypothetical protein
MTKYQEPYPSNYRPSPRDVRTMLALTCSNPQIVRDELRYLYGSLDDEDEPNLKPSKRSVR